MWPFTDPPIDQKLDRLLHVHPEQFTPQLCSTDLMRRASLHYLRIVQACCIASILVNLALAAVVVFGR